MKMSMIEALEKSRLEDNMAKVIPFAPIERLIRTAGAHRVSESAGVTLTEISEV